MSNERLHSLLGGSTANRVLNCPGSVILSMDLPPQIASEAAKEGTKAHEVLETILQDFLDHKIEGTDSGRNLDKLLDDPDVDSEMVDHAVACRDRIWVTALQESITGKAWGIEETFDFEKSLESFGSIDWWNIYIDDRAKRVGYILDYKYGTFPVEAEDNDQLKFYACALLNEIRLGGKDLDYIRCAIYQPRNRMAGENYEPYKEVKYTVKQLDTWRKKFLNAAHSIFVTKKAKYKTGKWCYFCPAQSKCELYAKELSKNTALKLLDIETEVLPPPEQIPDEVIAKVLQHEDELLEWVKACKKYAMNKSLNGGFPGFKVVNGPSRRQWRKDEDLELLLRTHSLSIDENPEILFNKKIKGIGEIEKLLKKHEGPDSVTWLNEVLVTKTTPPLLLVEQTDPRTAITGAADLLTVIDEEND